MFWYFKNNPSFPFVNRSLAPPFVPIKTSVLYNPSARPSSCWMGCCSIHTSFNKVNWLLKFTGLNLFLTHINRLQEVGHGHLWGVIILSILPFNQKIINIITHIIFYYFVILIFTIRNTWTLFYDSISFM